MSGQVVAPPTWMQTTIGQVCKISTGKLDVNASVAGGEYPFFTCAERIYQIDQYAFDTEAVLFAGNGDFNVKYYKGKFNAYQRTYVLHDLVLNGRYLFHYISHRMQQITGGSRGSTIKYIRLSDLRDHRIAVPSREVQTKIVDEIEAQLSRLDAAVANLQRVKANLKRYKASVLKGAIEGRLVPTEGNWTNTKLGKVALSVRNGYSHKPDAAAGTRIFRISAVRPMELNVDDVRYLSGTPSDYESFLAVQGDVLFTRYNGSRDYVGVCAVVPAGMPPTVYPDKLIRVRVPTSVLLPAFVVIAASTGRGRDFIESMIRTTAGQSGVSGSDIKAIPITIPPLEEQVRIVAEADRRMSLVRGVETDVDANLKRAQSLRQAVLAGAFGCSGRATQVAESSTT